MSYTTVTTYTTKLGSESEVESDCISCSERRLIKKLKHTFFKKGAIHFKSCFSIIFRRGSVENMEL